MKPHARFGIATWVAAAALAVAACQTAPPKVYTQSSPELDVAKYQTFGFLDKPATDQAGYRTLTTTQIESAVAREMELRGFRRTATNPDVLVNFNVETKDKVSGTTSKPSVNIGLGGWRGGYGWGVSTGSGRNDVRTETEGSLTIDLVDREKNSLVWSGTASGRLTEAARENPQPVIDGAVRDIFAKFPRPATSVPASEPAKVL